MGFYGADFRNGWATLVIVLATAGLQAIQMPAGYMLSSAGRMWLAFAMATGWAISFIGMNALLVRWGSIGLASARLIALGLHCLWTFAFAFYALNANQRAKDDMAINYIPRTAN